VVEGAALEIVETPGLARCLDCGGSVDMTDLLEHCACGSVNLELLAGSELKIKQMEVV
jgi:hydrogenase nickel incorporation protein HypA/HybF